MVKCYRILLQINRFYKPMLQTQVGTSIRVALKQAILDACAKIQQNFSNRVSPPVIGDIIATA